MAEGKPLEFAVCPRIETGSAGLYPKLFASESDAREFLKLESPSITLEEWAKKTAVSTEDLAVILERQEHAEETGDGTPQRPSPTHL